MGSITIGDGVLVGSYYTVNAYDDHYKSGKFAGYRLQSDVVDQLVDLDADWIVFLDPNRGRYTISLEDWQDYRIIDGEWEHVRQSRMSLG